ncbi:MAG: beta strand repeat-containing protein [Lacipirellulaceae bacterium]
MSSLRTVAACAVVLASSLASEALATRFWKNGVTNGTWGANPSWSSVSAAGADNAGQPFVGEAARIVHTDGVPRTATLDVNTPTIGLLAIDLTGGGTAANTLSLTTNNSLNAAGIFVGGHNGLGLTTGRGTLTQSAGTVTAIPGNDLYIGLGAGSTGIYDLSGGALNASLSTVVGSQGAGTFNHSGGTHTLLPEAIGGAFFVGYLGGSNGTYNLSGTGQLISNKTEYIGLEGTGSFNQTGGSNAIQGLANDLVLGNAASGNGTYTISGGTLTVGDDLRVGPGGTGALNVQGSGAVYVTDLLSIGEFGAVNVSGGTLRFNTYSSHEEGTVNYSAGTIRLGGNANIGIDAATSDFFGSFPVIGPNKGLHVEGVATANKLVTVNGGSLVSQGPLVVGKGGGNVGTLNISNGVVTTNGASIGVDRSGGPGAYSYGRGTVTVGANAVWNTGFLIMGDFESSGSSGQGMMTISAGGGVNSTGVSMGYSAYTSGAPEIPSVANVTGVGSTWNSTGNMSVGSASRALLTVADRAVVHVQGELSIGANSRVVLEGGTVRLQTLGVYHDGNPANVGVLAFNSGTIQLAGGRNLGGDPVIQAYYGAIPTVPLGKGLTVEGDATLTKPLKIDGGTFKANGLTVGAGGSLLFQSGGIEISGGTITGLAQLNVPTNGEFRAVGSHTVRVAAAVGSTITPTGLLVIGDFNAVNGFYTNGTVNVGANTLAITDANDAVFDSAALVTLGGSGPGQLDALNGLTLNFGGNITGFGEVFTSNAIFTPLINNGHITGASPSQRITLPGYVKGVGTFDNVTFTGTFAPGLSPTSLVVGSVGLSNSSTLLMEIGGTSPGSGYDQVLASGALTLDGTMAVSLLGGFVPSIGQSFNLFDWGTLSGTFDSLSLPSLGGGLNWDTSQLYTTGVLSVAAAGLPGDYNTDGVVNAADYTTWRDNLGSTTALANDDTPGVAADDYVRWFNNYGASASRSAAEAVPEPTAAMLAALLAALTPRAGGPSRTPRAGSAG